ncbi:HAMP domain-containing histidine kinase [Rhodobacteraceae bacterium B1Z28]|uniref:histidine kinase n=1 Tax=Ruegeria haliotis TaxID=2747601 RepID=A0ABX2PT74_9RHOB|nr:HAMP domain-containing sensor histidine kinase [Ruegeria haliotis]NVO57369.1 HAMP domain-containing histidine kinase [Ruegeria haliotis]
MDRASIFSGAPFRTACYAAMVVWVITAVFGYAAYLALQDRLRFNLEQQILEEELLLHEILLDGGADAVQRAVEHLNSPNRTGLHMIALFNNHNSALAGSVAKIPDANGWHEVDPDFVEVGGSAPVYLLHATDYLGYRTVVARSMTSLNQALTTLWEGLLFLTLATTSTVLGLGYYVSSQSYRKLKRIERTLDLVSQGDTDIRLPVSKMNDQIDRVSGLMNRHLDRLSSLLISTQTTAVTIAHDLKTPLSHGFLALQQVYSEVEYGGDPRPRLYELETELKRLSSVFDTILRISRIEAGGPNSQFTPVNLSALVEDVVETFSPIASDEEKVITADYNADTVLIRGDEHMLKQMLVNLVNNSLRYCPSGSWTRISLTATSESVELVVEDNGPGVPKAQIGKIFDAFYRAAATSNDNGNGLGLALVKAVAVRHGAMVSAEDNDPGLRIRCSFRNT